MWSSRHLRRPRPALTSFDDDSRDLATLGRHGKALMAILGSGNHDSRRIKMCICPTCLLQTQVSIL